MTEREAEPLPPPRRRQVLETLAVLLSRSPSLGREAGVFDVRRLIVDLTGEAESPGGRCVAAARALGVDVQWFLELSVGLDRPDDVLDDDGLDLLARRVGRRLALGLRVFA